MQHCVAVMRQCAAIDLWACIYGYIYIGEHQNNNVVITVRQCGGVCGSASSSVWQCARQCAALRQCPAVSDSAAVCNSSAAVCGSAAVCASVVVRGSACGSVCGSVRVPYLAIHRIIRGLGLPTRLAAHSTSVGDKTPPPAAHLTSGGGKIPPPPAAQLTSGGGKEVWMGVTPPPQLTADVSCRPPPLGAKPEINSHRVDDGISASTHDLLHI
jgi:hypothetical protein